MLSYTDLKKGVLFVLDGDPYEVIDSSFLRMQQRKAVVQTKIRNLITGKILDRNWQASDYFEEAEISKDDATFIYAHRDEYWFHWGSDPKNRFSLNAEMLGESRQFLKAGTKVTALKFKDKIIKISLPIKMDFKVIEAPPAVRGNTAQGGNKVVEIEGGAKITAPLFIETDDIIKINTETGQYVERVEKA